MARNGEAARQVFGVEAVNRCAAAAEADATRRIAASDVLAATFSAAHSVRLTGRTTWTGGEQQRMASELADETRRQLDAGRDTQAAERAALLQMLSGQFPWTEEEASRLRNALSHLAGTESVYHSVSVADQVADFLLLSGQPFWSEDEFREMRKAVIADFEDCLARGDEVLAADRLVIFDVLESSYEALASTRNDAPR